MPSCCMYAACAFSELGWHVSADLKVWVRRIKYVLFYMSDQLQQSSQDTINSNHAIQGRFNTGPAP